MSIKDYPNPDRVFLKCYTDLWITMAQVGVKCRIKYTPELGDAGRYPSGAVKYKVVNQQERRKVISNGNT